MKKRIDRLIRTLDDLDSSVVEEILKLALRSNDLETIRYTYETLREKFDHEETQKLKNRLFKAIEHRKVGNETITHSGIKRPYWDGRKYCKGKKCHLVRCWVCLGLNGKCRTSGIGFCEDCAPRIAKELREELRK